MGDGENLREGENLEEYTSCRTTFGTAKPDRQLCRSVHGDPFLERAAYARWQVRHNL